MSDQNSMTPEQRRADYAADMAGQAAEKRQEAFRLQVMVRTLNNEAQRMEHCVKVLMRGAMQ